MLVVQIATHIQLGLARACTVYVSWQGTREDAFVSILASFFYMVKWRLSACDFINEQPAAWKMGAVPRSDLFLRTIGGTCAHKELHRRLHPDETLLPRLPRGASVKQVLPLLHAHSDTLPTRDACHTLRAPRRQAQTAPYCQRWLSVQTEHARTRR